MTALFACIATACGVFALIQTVRLDVEKVATSELRSANRKLEAANRDMAHRLSQYRGNYKPLPGEFDRLHVIRGGRNG